MSDYRAAFDLEINDASDLAVFAERQQSAHVTGVNHQADNNTRASFAAVALVAYIKRVGEDEVETNVSDLLGDIMHLCDALGIDFDDMIHRGLRHYDREVKGMP